MKRIITALLLSLILCTSVSAATYYVSPVGSDANVGSIQKPFATIQKAASVMKAGDMCFLRAGSYHEPLVLEDLHGSPGQPLVFSAFEQEKVVLNGARVIESKWNVHQGNIYKTKLDDEVWQLFVNEKAMISARWPNANWDDGSMFDQTVSWAHQGEGS